MIGVSALVGLSANSQYDKAAKNCTKVDGNLECPDPADRKSIDDASSKANLATVIGIGGGLLAAGAVVVYVTAPRAKETGVTVAPMASPGGAGVSISGRF